jgi:hypothetical protein
MFMELLKSLHRLGVLLRTSRFVNVLVGVWLVYAFQSYLPALVGNPLLQLDRHLRRSGAYDVVLVLWFASAAYCTGRRLLKLLGVSATPGAEQTAFAVAMGAAAFSLAATILGLVHGLYRPVAYALLVVPSALWRDELAGLYGSLRRVVIEALKKLSWSARSLGYGSAGAYIVLVLAVVFLSTLSPSFDYDDLMYHLAGPKNFALHHGLVPLFDVPNALFPKNIEMLYTLALLWHCDVTAKLVHFMCGILVMLSVYAFAVRFLSRAVGVVAIAILVSSHLFVWEMRTAHNDIGLALFIIVGVYAVVLWLWDNETAWLRLAICFLAFSLGIKYWALLALGVIAMLVFVVQICKTRALLAATRSAGKLVPVCLGLVPWSLVSLYYTGNPFFPLLNGIFRSPYWSSAHTDLALGQMHTGGIAITASRWWELVGFWWTMMVDPRAMSGGNLGPFYVMLLPLVLLMPGVGRALWFVFASSVLYYLGWIMSGPHLRFLIPALPGFALAAACGAVGWLRLLGSMHRSLAVAGATLLGVSAILSSPFFERYGASARYGFGLIETLPISYLSGEESKSDYLSRYHPGFLSVQFLNQLPGPKKVYYVHALPDGFYLDGRASYQYSPFAPGLRNLKADDIHRVLRENGVTHVVVKQLSNPFDALGSREHEFTRRYLHKLYQRNAHIVYELLPAPADQESVEFDFLQHLSQGHASGSRPIHQVRRVSDDTRSVMVTTPPSEVEFAVEIGRAAALSFALGRGNPTCTESGTFQVWIQSEEQGRRMVYRREVGRESSAGWLEDRVDLSAYDGDQTKIAFKTEDPSGCCDYFWADPVLIVRNSHSPILGNDRSPESEPHLVVTDGGLVPARLRVGESFCVKFSGNALPANAYFDVRFKSPGASGEEVAFNWQRGTFSRHTVDPGMQPGIWAISGARAHRYSRDHSGEFSPVWIVLTINP